MRGEEEERGASVGRRVEEARRGLWNLILLGVGVWGGLHRQVLQAVVRRPEVGQRRLPPRRARHHLAYGRWGGEMRGERR